MTEATLYILIIAASCSVSDAVQSYNKNHKKVQLSCGTVSEDDQLMFPWPASVSSGNLPPAFHPLSLSSRLP